MPRTELKQAIEECANRIKGDFAKYFLSEDDLPWKNWLDLPANSGRINEIVAKLLLDNKVRVGIKARALMVMYCPDRSVLPIYLEEGATERGCSRIIAISELPAELRPLLAEMIRAFLPVLWREGDSAGWIPETRNNYNQTVMGLMEYLPEEEALDLFNYWEPKDIVLNQHRTVSGYNPFFTLLIRSKLPYIIKRADEIMRAEISAECKEEELKDRYEGVAKCYGEIIASCPSYRTGKAPEIMASQVEFLLGIPEPRLTEALRHVGNNLGSFFVNLRDEGDAETKLKLARTILTTFGDEVSVSHFGNIEEIDRIVAGLKEAGEPVAEALLAARASGAKEREKFDLEWETTIEALKALY